MILKIEIREVEIKEWNERHNLATDNLEDFSINLYEKISRLFNVNDERLDSFQAWYDKIITIEYDVENTETTIDEIKVLLEEVEIENINIF